MKRPGNKILFTAMGASCGLTGFIPFSRCMGNPCASCLGCAGAGLAVLLIALYTRFTKKDNGND